MTVMINDQERVAGFEHMLKLMEKWRLGVITSDEGAKLNQLVIYFKNYTEVLDKSLQ